MTYGSIEPLAECTDYLTLKPLNFPNCFVESNGIFTKYLGNEIVFSS